MSEPTAEHDLLIDGPDAAPTLVLGHGAGAPMDHPWMQDLASGLAASGLRVVRFEFPYMARRRTEDRRPGPDRPPVLHRTWRQVVAQVGNPSGLVIGGKSMGGRIASMVADELGVAGLVCLGYPFHPPGKPETLRTAHLAELTTPTLVLQGTRDPFGKPEEVADYRLSRAIRVHWLDDGDHSLKPRVRSGRTLQQNLQEATAEIVAFATAL